MERSDAFETDARLATGMVALLRAVITGKTDLDISRLEPSLVRHALASGLGPVLAHVSAAAPTDSPFADWIRAADLTARLLTAEKYDVLDDVLGAAHAVGCSPVLLKGVSTAPRYYPAPHLRTMGDIDLLVQAARQPALEQQLRGLGFQQSSTEPPVAFIQRHHSMPFWHPERHVWIEVHSRLNPPLCALADDPRFSPDAIASQLTSIELGNREARVMNHELQLVYTSARWLERFDRERGIYPLLDAAFLIRTQGDTLDWDRVRSIVKHSWATTALHLMVSYLLACDLARVPVEVIAWLEDDDRLTNRASIRLLHRLITGYVLEGQSFGWVLTTQKNVEGIWRLLVQPASVWVNLLSASHAVSRALPRVHFPRV